ncbi:MFS transporter [Acinetobacter gerneri]|jgi:MFS family permease|uniref:MFS transporter n=1 Tax=Acinetobacter gerneri TaxID=202952 RepID=A0AAW8JC45_9GAMM|nr:MFS transporter [Acinetobacter gerneri]MCH4245480.1 MFS transporter [Acinetobacter gerneri]MDQ9009830.1 MFS transporter [Acinetobacter gerneri]MDQ9013928.1 MFS transporter [Acinetobacter gerneri]MDQ9023617.1 MFS transporter [Acinetobacter gerneri]MDQ9052493.1 MFS transporter [Acinetobacter gerneri]
MNQFGGLQQNSGSKLSPNAALVLHTANLMSFMAAASAPAPLYQIYQRLWHFSPVILTLIFATYALFLLLALLIAGSISDYIGRKPVILLAILLQMTSMMFFLFSNDINMLFVARAIQGIATALAVSSIGAALLDLNKHKGPIINSICPMLGMTVGSILACLVLQYSNAPLHLIFEILIVIYLIEFILTIFSPETAVKRSGALASLKLKMAVPPAAKFALISISPVNIALWMLSGIFLSLMPSLFVQAFQIHSAWLNGLSFSAITLSGAIGIILLRKSASVFILKFGTIHLILGTIILILGINLVNIYLLFIGSIIAGLGFGTSFMGAIRTVMPLAKPEERAGLMAAFYVESYLAFSVPAIIAGLLVQKIGLINSTNLYAFSIVALSILALFFIFRLPKTA